MSKVTKQLAQPRGPLMVNGISFGALADEAV